MSWEFLWVLVAHVVTCEAFSKWVVVILLSRFLGVWLVNELVSTFQSLWDALPGSRPFQWRVGGSDSQQTICHRELPQVSQITALEHSSSDFLPFVCENQDSDFLRLGSCPTILCNLPRCKHFADLYFRGGSLYCDWRQVHSIVGLGYSKWSFQADWSRKASEFLEYRRGKIPGGQSSSHCRVYGTHLSDPWYLGALSITGFSLPFSTWHALLRKLVFSPKNTTRHYSSAPVLSSHTHYYSGGLWGKWNHIRTNDTSSKAFFPWCLNTSV